MRPSILIVDDDEVIQQTLFDVLKKRGYDIFLAGSGKESLEMIQKNIIDVILLDMKLPDVDGLDVLKKIKEFDSEILVIMMTGYGDIQTAVAAMKSGAYHYINKPFELDELKLLIEKGLETKRLINEVRRLHRQHKEPSQNTHIHGMSPHIQYVRELIGMISKTQKTSVLIQGESGTGKELAANAIHYHSKRSDRPLMKINCSAIPDTLLEAELFGYEKGAFTDAKNTKKGLFELADGGTVFLDEIGDMPLSIQAKLLRALQERQFYPIGSQKPVEVDVRVIVATQKDLEEHVKQGLFREDLFYRIHVIPILLPPLRERKEDIPLLAEYFLKKFSEQMKKEVKGLTSQAMQKLMIHDWPGNVRELENTIEYAVVMTQQDIINEDFVLQSKGNISKEPLKPLKEARDTYEKGYLIHLLEICEGNVSKASKLAGKYRADFYDLLKKHNLKSEDFKKPQ